MSFADVPSEVDSYHSLFPLEPLPPPNRMQKTSNFSYITSCYKAVNSKDDLPYCLRRIHGKRRGDGKILCLKAKNCVSVTTMIEFHNTEYVICKVGFKSTRSSTTAQSLRTNCLANWDYFQL